MLRAIAAVAVLCAAFLLLMWGVVGSRAHDDMDWVAQGALKNKAGEWCCGRGDCEALAPEDVKAVDGGYWIISLKEFVPQSETLPLSPDQFIRCHRPDGSRRCFIVPPQGF